YVAGSSTIVPQIQATSSWQGSQLSITIRKPRRRRQRWPLAALGAAVLLIVAASFAWYKLRPTSAPPADSGLAGTSPPAIPSVAANDPNVLTVAQDGTAQFTSITAALEKVRPGMTVRLLDDAIYRERIL